MQLGQTFSCLHTSKPGLDPAEFASFQQTRSYLQGLLGAGTGDFPCFFHHVQGLPCYPMSVIITLLWQTTNNHVGITNCFHL